MNSIAIPTIFVSLTLFACGGASDIDEPTPTTTASTSDAGMSVCILPETGGFGSVCYGDTPYSQSWVWIDPTDGMQHASDGGEQSQRCNVATCPSGATCIVENELSDGSLQLLMGSCQ
jgi:hypothetical protein